MKMTSVRGLARAGLMAAAMVAIAVPAVAQELKIGYVNSERVLRDAAPAKAAQTKLEAEFGKRDRELIEQAQKLNAAAEKLEKDAPTLGEAERTRRQRDVLEMERDLQRKRRAFQEDLQQRKNEELAGVVERANRVIKQIFESEKYDLILTEVPFASARVDITDKVIKALNAAPTGGR